jgi:hypothetical protein
MRLISQYGMVGAMAAVAKHDDRRQAEWVAVEVRLLGIDESEFAGKCYLRL